MLGIVVDIQSSGLAGYAKRCRVEHNCFLLLFGVHAGNIPCVGIPAGQNYVFARIAFKQFDSYSISVADSEKYI